jgi:hypothetical protein
LLKFATHSARLDFTLKSSAPERGENSVVLWQFKYGSFQPSALSCRPERRYQHESSFRPLLISRHSPLPVGVEHFASRIRALGGKTLEVLRATTLI